VPSDGAGGGLGFGQEIAEPYWQEILTQSLALRNLQNEL
jgi:hypothetical protein